MPETDTPSPDRLVRKGRRKVGATVSSSTVGSGKSTNSSASRCTTARRRALNPEIPEPNEEVTVPNCRISYDNTYLLRRHSLASLINTGRAKKDDKYTRTTVETFREMREKGHSNRKLRSGVTLMKPVSYFGVVRQHAAEPSSSRGSAVDLYAAATNAGFPATFVGTFLDQWRNAGSERLLGDTINLREVVEVMGRPQVQRTLGYLKRLGTTPAIHEELMRRIGSSYGECDVNVYLFGLINLICQERENMRPHLWYAIRQLFGAVHDDEKAVVPFSQIESILEKDVGYPQYNVISVLLDEMVWCLRASRDERIILKKVCDYVVWYTNHPSAGGEGLLVNGEPFHQKWSLLCETQAKMQSLLVGGRFVQFRELEFIDEPDGDMLAMLLFSKCEIAVRPAFKETINSVVDFIQQNSKHNEAEKNLLSWVIHDCLAGRVNEDSADTEDIVEAWKAEAREGQRRNQHLDLKTSTISISPKKKVQNVRMLDFLAFAKPTESSEGHDGEG